MCITPWQDVCPCASRGELPVHAATGVTRRTTMPASHAPEPRLRPTRTSVRRGLMPANVADPYVVQGMARCRRGGGGGSNNGWNEPPPLSSPARPEPSAEGTGASYPSDQGAQRLNRRRVTYDLAAAGWLQLRLEQRAVVKAPSAATALDPRDSSTNATMAPTVDAQARARWYPDPMHTATYRHWNGARWTNHTA
jgi:Protein of unknown function (DUF2510)